MVSFSVVVPQDVICQVAMANQKTGFRWEGEVNAARQVTEQTMERVGAEQPCQALACHNETLVVNLADGTRIEYGAAPSDWPTFEDYLATTRDVLLQIVASYAPH